MFKVIKTKNGWKTQKCRHGWDDFMALFEMKDCIEVLQIEVSLQPTQILEGGNKSTQYNNVPKQKNNFIMLGKVGLKPDKILQMLREDRFGYSLKNQ